MVKTEYHSLTFLTVAIYLNFNFKSYEPLKNAESFVLERLRNYVFDEINSPFKCSEVVLSGFVSMFHFFLSYDVASGG